MSRFYWILFIFECFLIHCVISGCCNEGYWCDGDPHFKESPDVIQPTNSPYLLVSWPDTYLHLGKCVDFFYVEYKENNSSLDYKKTPVFFKQQQVLKHWEDSMKPMWNKYWANLTVQFNKIYLIRAVAVDRGSNWRNNNNQGSAIVYSSELSFHTRAILNETLIPDGFNITKQMLDSRYPPNKCNKIEFCEELAHDWLYEVGVKFLNTTLRYHDPQFVGIIDLRHIDEESTGRLYEQGRIHNLKQTKIIKIETFESKNETMEMQITFGTRLFRLSYFWDSFFTSGILSMYHTCGKKLPTTFFEDIDENEVEELIDNQCFFKTKLFLQCSINSCHSLKITNLKIYLNKEDVDYDTTWITKHFHNLTILFNKQKKIAFNQLKEIFYKGFNETITRISPHNWLNRRYAYIT